MKRTTLQSKMAKLGIERPTSRWCRTVGECRPAGGISARLRLRSASGFYHYRKRMAASHLLIHSPCHLAEGRLLLRTSVGISSGHRVLFELTGVTFVEVVGMHFPAQEHWNGGRLVGGATTRAIVEEIRVRERTATTEERAMTVFLEESTHFAVLDVEGTLRAPIRPELRHRVETLLSRRERRILLHLARLTDIDAAGIGELIRIYKATIAAGGVLQVTHPQKRVRQLLDLAATLDLLTDASGD